MKALVNMAAPEFLSQWCSNVSFPFYTNIILTLLFCHQYAPCEILMHFLAFLVMILICNLLNWKWKHTTEASVTISLAEYCKLITKIQLLERERERAVMDKYSSSEKKILTDQTIADVSLSNRSLISNDTVSNLGLKRFKELERNGQNPF